MSRGSRRALARWHVAALDLAGLTGLAAVLGAAWIDLPVSARPGGILALHGPLGAGKTTWTRALLVGMGWRGAVRSPTYTLIEPYELAGSEVFHLDLYRLGDAEELELLGVRELLDGRRLLLIEWPERGQGWLPPAAVEIRLGLTASAAERCLQATVYAPEWCDLLSGIGAKFTNCCK